MSTTTPPVSLADEGRQLCECAERVGAEFDRLAALLRASRIMRPGARQRAAHLILEARDKMARVAKVIEAEARR